MPKLITGGLGFIGSHLARKLVEMGEEVILFDIMTESKLIDDIRHKVTVIRGDLGNQLEVMNLIKEYKPNTIFHTAALLSASAELSPLAAYTINANGTLYILEAARIFNVPEVIFLSSISTYGPGVPDRVDDDTVQRPTTMYGVTKVISERLGEYYHVKFGLNFRGLRFPSVIGPGRGSGGASAYSSLIIQEPAEGRPYDVFVDGEAKIPLLYIEDAVQAMISLENVPETKLRRRIYNIEGFSPTAYQLAAVVKKYIPSARIRFCPDAAMMEIVRSWPKELDGSNARRDWGWQTKYDLDEALRHFIKNLHQNESPG